MQSDPEVLADRIRQHLQGRNVTTKRMFGGLTFLLDGNMLCCAGAKGLMARVGAAQDAQALQRPHASPCLGAGRRMAGFILVSPAGLVKDKDLRAWLDLALRYVSCLPAKSAVRRRRSATRKVRAGRVR